MIKFLQIYIKKNLNNNLKSYNFIIFIKENIK